MCFVADMPSYPYRVLEPLSVYLRSICSILINLWFCFSLSTYPTCALACVFAYSVCPFLHLCKCVCMPSRPQISHCLCAHYMPMCSSLCAQCVFQLSVSIYIHKHVWWWDSVVSPPFLSKSREQWREKRGEEGMNSISLVWKLPVAWAEAAGRKGGGEERRVFICSSARGNTRWREAERGIIRGEEAKKSVPMLISKRESAWECDTGGGGLWGELEAEVERKRKFISRRELGNIQYWVLSYLCSILIMIHSRLKKLYKSQREIVLPMYI